MRELSKNEVALISGRGIDCAQVGQTYASVFHDVATTVGAGYGALYGPWGAAAGAAAGSIYGQSVYQSNQRNAEALCTCLTGSGRGGGFNPVGTPPQMNQLVEINHWRRTGLA